MSDPRIIVHCAPDGSITDFHSPLSASLTCSLCAAEADADCVHPDAGCEHYPPRCEYDVPRMTMAQWSRIRGTLRAEFETEKRKPRILPVGESQPYLQEMELIWGRALCALCGIRRSEHDGHGHAFEEPG